MAAARTRQVGRSMVADAVGTILAYTAEKGRLDAVRRAAFDLAKRGGDRVILYDIDAAGFFAPLPTEWSGEGSEKEFGDLLGPADLERAGRHEIAAQVVEARAQGIDAWAWLPGDLGLEALADYARRVGADVIIVPREAGRTQGLLAGLKQPKPDELSAQTQRLGANVMVVDEGAEQNPR